MIRSLATISVSILALASFVFADPIPKWILEEQFLRACQESNEAEVKRLLDLGISPSVKDRFGQPAIIRAARGGFNTTWLDQHRVIKLLLDAGADINSRNDYGTTAIFLTATNNRAWESETFKLLRSRNPDFGAKDIYGLEYEQWPNFYSFVKLTESELAWRLLLENNLGAKPETDPGRYKNSATWAMAGVYYGQDFEHWRPVAEPSAIDGNGETYLFYAASRKRFALNELDEVEKGIVNIRSKSGETALIRAARFGNDMLIAKLLGANADTSIRDNAGRTALEYAVDYDNYFSTLSLLIKADTAQRDEKGATPLIRAVSAGSVRAVAAFAHARKLAGELAAEAKRNEEKRAAFNMMAAAYRRIDPDLRDRSGRTALHIAADRGDAVIVEAILMMGAKRDLKDRSGATAVSIARAKGHQDVIKLLNGK